MRSAFLQAHPDSPGAGVSSVEAAISREAAGVLTLSYVVTGDVASLVIPERVAPDRADGLWKHTCFEVFLRTTAGPAYWEFNLAPSSRWAAYAFTDYRQRDADPEAAAPFIDAEAGRTRFQLRATLDAGRITGLPADEPWRIGLSAVLESGGGSRAYWALAHPPGQPDFHHADAFALSLPPPGHP